MNTWAIDLDSHDSQTNTNGYPSSTIRCSLDSLCTLASARKGDRGGLEDTLPLN